MAHVGYGFFCPVAKVSEILEPRWTMLILAEMANGSTRFNDIRRGVPGISPTLLTKRLRELEGFGLVERLEDKASGTIDYVQTGIAEALNPIIWELGQWAWAHVEAEISLETLNAQALMWNVRRNIFLERVVSKRTVLQFHFPDQPKPDRRFWMIWRPGVEIDVCLDDPGFDVALYIEAELKAFTSYWMNWTSLSQEMDQDRISLIGDKVLIRTFDQWLERSTFGRDRTSGESSAQTVSLERVKRVDRSDRALDGAGYADESRFHG